MRRAALHTLLTTLVVMAVAAPAALAHDGGEGLWGETNDKVITNAGFFLIAFFPVLIFVLSIVQWRLDKRKDARKKAAKARSARADLRGGW
jgi:preprotein translocase subunit SecG